ncbi:MAG: hypothetical protein ACLP00_24570, partial [Terracidiphilus sp.]
ETVAELVAHYRLKELVGENQGRKSFSTRAGYESYLNGWILPRWGDHRNVTARTLQNWEAGKGTSQMYKKTRDLRAGVTGKMVGWHSFRPQPCNEPPQSAS